ncbi:hypothetical protein F5Y16DRAFT_421368 [Xylariaceae sp. FL0255]|nr:hypothetical protein F5Y16DRAFT_421368 [Xylariaceae sp. FL0255]
MPWTTLHLSPIGDAMSVSKTSTRTRRTHTFVQGLLAHATSAASAFQKASSRHIGSHVRHSFAGLAAREESKTWSSIAKNVLVHLRNTGNSAPNAGNPPTRTSLKNILRLASIDCFPYNSERLYGAFFPEDRRLTLDAHDAGVDVTMTIRLVKAYLLRAFNMPLPGKIDSHFSSADRGAKGWELDAEKLFDLLEKATPAIALSEVVDDNEISQSGIDKLLDDDDESLEDIPDDESAEDLSIRLEQKNLLDDPMDY